MGDGLGGVEKAVRETATRMVENGHDVTCYCKSAYSTDNDYKGVKLINIKTQKGKHLETLIYSIKAILHACRQDYDIIHIHALASACLAWIPKFIYKKHVIISVHGLDWQREKWGFIARQVLKFGEWASVKFANSTLCVSKSLCMYYKMKYNQDNIKYIPNGCDIDDEQYQALPEYKKSSYFLYLGRLVPEKGVHNLIEAYKGLTTNKKLIITGPESDRTYFQQLKKAAEGHKNIIFTGAMYDQQKVRLLANAYMFVLPSAIEGLPIALLEAASYGVCTAVSEIPTCKEVIDNTVIACGFHFNPHSIKELQTVLNMASQSKELVKALGSKLKQHVKKQYNWDDISRQSLEAYEQVL
jgi:glycosyltransferase involved in cell wall biosynthesis